MLEKNTEKHERMCDFFLRHQNCQFTLSIYSSQHPLNAQNCVTDFSTSLPSLLKLFSLQLNSILTYTNVEREKSCCQDGKLKFQNFFLISFKLLDCVRQLHHWIAWMNIAEIRGSIWVRKWNINYVKKNVMLLRIFFFFRTLHQSRLQNITQKYFTYTRYEYERWLLLQKWKKNSHIFSRLSSEMKMWKFTCDNLFIISHLLYCFLCLSHIESGLRYKNIGKSGLRVSNVALGTWSVVN